jgi:hypothetical protein
MVSYSSQAPDHDSNHANLNHRLTVIQANFIISAQPAGLEQPAERAFYHPSSRQHFEAFEVVAAAHNLQPQLAEGTKLLHPVDQGSQITAVSPNDLQSSMHKGNLGAFLERVRKSHKKGSVLISEKLDRFSRNYFEVVFPVWLDLLHAGIEIYSCVSRVHYTVENIRKNPMLAANRLSIVNSAWAERAKKAGYPERFPQEALGHNSKAVHRAYAKRAQVRLPSLEEYERSALVENVIPISLQTGSAA